MKVKNIPILTLLFTVIPLLIFGFQLIPTLKPMFQNISIGFGVLVLSSGVVAMITRRYGWAKTIKWVSIYYFSFTIAVWLVYVVSRVIVFTDVHGLEMIMREQQAAAKWIYFLICYAQPILLPIPEAVTVLAGSTILGAFQAFLLAFVGTMLGIATMFLLARLGGMKLVSRFIKPQQLERYHRFVRKNENFIMALLFIIPVLPDEIVCVGAGVSGVSPRKFLLIAGISKLATSFLLAYSVQLAKWLSMTPSQVMLSLAVAAGAVFLTVFIFKKRTLALKRDSL